MNLAVNTQLAQPKITPVAPRIHQIDETEEGLAQHVLFFDLEACQVPLDTPMSS